MSSPTQPIVPASGLMDPLAEEGFERPLLILAGRGRPPQHVLAEMAHADAVYMHLARRGQLIAFVRDGFGAPAFELRDANGTLLRTLSVAEAAELACGQVGE
jgi:hypothetical protein